MIHIALFIEIIYTRGTKTLGTALRAKTRVEAKEMVEDTEDYELVVGALFTTWL